MTLFLQTLILGLLVGGVYALMSSGFSLVFGVMRIINLSHAAMIVLAAFLTWWVWDRTGLDPLLVGVLVTPVMYGVGWLLYKAVIARVHRIDHELAMVASFGVAVAAGGVMSLIWGTEVRSATPRYFNQSFEVGSLAVPKAQLYACLGAVVILAAPGRPAARHLPRPGDPRLRDQPRQRGPGRHQRRADDGADVRDRRGHDRRSAAPRSR